jgi:hypothetical protein
MRSGRSPRWRAALFFSSLAACACLLFVGRGLLLSSAARGGAASRWQPAAAAAAPQLRPAAPRAPPAASPPPAPRARHVCSARERDAAADAFRVHESSCPGDGIWPALLAALHCGGGGGGGGGGALRLANVGANKAYLAASWISALFPSRGITPAAVHASLMAAFPALSQVTEDRSCGSCYDCRAGEAPAAAPPPGCAPRAAGAAPPPVRVDAFEPVAINCELIERGLGAMLGALGGGLAFELHRAAVVGDPAAATANIARCTEPGFEQCAVVAGDGGGAPVDAVPATTLDAWAARALPAGAPVDVLSIDAEGGDPEALDGAQGLLRAGRVRVLSFEYNGVGSWAGARTLREEVERLDALGLDCFWMQRSTLLRLTGTCWAPAYETRSWSNVLCVPRTEHWLGLAAEALVPDFGA